MGSRVYVFERSNEVTKRPHREEVQRGGASPQDRNR